MSDGVGDDVDGDVVVDDDDDVHLLSLHDVPGSHKNKSWTREALCHIRLTAGVHFYWNGVCFYWGGDDDWS